MRVAVVGATGNVGTSVTATLASDDRVTDILAIARRPPEVLPPRTRFVGSDITTDDLTPSFDGVDAVIHLAWLFQPTHRPMVTWRNNVEGSIRVFDAVARARVPALVYASSVGAYSPPPSDDSSVDEMWPTHSVPTAGYGREKAYVERVLDAFESRHPQIRVVRFRPSFIFKRAAATEQRRLFAGPFLPGVLVRPGRLPLLPYPRGLRFQAMHTDDVADAYRRAVFGDVRGAFNLAAEPVIDGPTLAEALGARGIPVSRMLVRAGVAAAWHLHALPAAPTLLDLIFQLPLLDTTRARTELGWAPRVSGVDALRETLVGMAEGAGAPTAPLAPDSGARRMEEVASGVGEH